MKIQKCFIISEGFSEFQQEKYKANFKSFNCISAASLQQGKTEKHKIVYFLGSFWRSEMWSFCRNWAGANLIFCWIALNLSCSCKLLSLPQIWPPRSPRGLCALRACTILTLMTNRNQQAQRNVCEAGLGSKMWIEPSSNDYPCPPSPTTEFHL